MTGLFSLFLVAHISSHVEHVFSSVAWSCLPALILHHQLSSTSGNYD